MTSPDETSEKDPTRRYVGFGPAAAYLGLARNTLSSYVTRGIGPVPEPEREPVGQYLLPVFTEKELDRWQAGRPGQGARTDLVSASA